MTYFWGKLAEVLSGLFLFYPTLKAIMGQAIFGRILRKSFAKNPDGDIDWLYKMLFDARNRRLLRVTKLDVAMFCLGFVFFVYGSYLSTISAMTDKGHQWSNILEDFQQKLTYIENLLSEGEKSLQDKQ